ncbi:MAG: enoyl-CoA hydratase-related protein [Gammaproteobacteria bacterium]
MNVSRTEIRFDDIEGGQVAHVALLGDKSLNVVDGDCLRGMAHDVAELCARPDLRCVLLRGRDARAFIGGANLDALHRLDRASAAHFIGSVHDLCAVLRAAPVPIVAVLQGYCLGAGLEVAAACDMRIGDFSVACGMPEVRVGVPSVVEAALLPGLIGWGKARELMLRGHIIDARESHAIGLLQHLVESSSLDELAGQIAADIVAGAPGAIAAQKRLFLAWEELPVSAAIDRGVPAFVEACSGEEPRRAIDAFFALQRERKRQGRA